MRLSIKRDRASESLSRSLVARMLAYGCVTKHSHHLHHLAFGRQLYTKSIKAIYLWRGGSEEYLVAMSVRRQAKRSVSKRTVGCFGLTVSLLLVGMELLP